jgi:methyl-accepting chemotaxis protein
MNYAADMLKNDSVAGLEALQTITSDCKQYRLFQFKYYTASDVEMLKIEGQMNEKSAQIVKEFTDYEASVTQDEDRRNIEDLKTKWNAYMSYQDQLLALAHKHDVKSAEKLMSGPMYTAFISVSDELTTMSDWNAKHASVLAGDASAAYASAKSTVTILLSVAVVLGVLMAIIVTKIVVGNLKLVSGAIDDLSGICLANLGNAVDALAVGDLTMKVETGIKPLDVKTKDEFGALAETVNAIIGRADQTVKSFVQAQASLSKMADAADEIAGGNLHVDVKPLSDKDILGNAFKKMTVSLLEVARAANEVAEGNLTVAVKPQSEKDILGNAVDKMIKNLSNLIAQTRYAAENIGASAEEVSAGNQDLSQRTEEQASNLEETAASMEEMTSTVKQNADNSREANQLASHARELAEKGGEVVGSAVSAMGQISDGSKKIAEIISVIDEIAFQTNLLALNASVEAARVGEQGRGFAVVASEVRNLAGRSSTAAKEIKNLVNDTVQKVQDGSTLVNQSGAQLNEIVAAVKKVADIIAEISAASIEQSAGIDQVNKAVMQMDQMTQQNAALVEEAAGTSESMAQLARDLQQVVSKFQLDQRYIQAMPQMAAPAERRATGTYGAGSRAGKRPGSSRPKTRLHLVGQSGKVDGDSGVTSGPDIHDGQDDFEEF